ncbi:MAG: hypothetical protein LBB56_02300 [Chitinispirillales bacterium]|jgi:hypothetical protein|nr:hypothetical protein [Chitinispirillales bacterium]
MNGSQRKESIKQFSTQNINDDCYSLMAFGLFSADHVLFEDSLGSILKSRSVKGRFSHGLFILLSRNEPLVNNKKIWSAVTEAWIASNVLPVYSILAAHSEGGRLPAADSLYRALDAAGKLDFHDYLRWGRVKSLLGDFRGSAAQYCKAVTADGRMIHTAVTQMGQLFLDAESDEQSTALEDFKRCVLSIDIIDTAYFRNWLADFYGRSGVYDSEIKVLVELDILSSPAARRLADIARDHFSKRRYRYAANSAVLAYQRLEQGAQRSNTALIAYQSYMQFGVKDSALIWLKRSGLTDAAALAAAAGLYQETGHLASAAAFIDSLNASLSKDTLLIRQRLFSNEIDKALSLASSNLLSWRQHPREKSLWQARCFIFSGQAEYAIPVIDSVKFSASWHASAELLRYKYWMQKLSGESGALSIWGNLEYLIYTGDLTSAVEKLKVYGLNGDIGEMIAVRAAGALMREGRVTEALLVLDLVKNGVGSPEYLYVKAEALFNAGRKDDARVTAGKLLTDFPLDIFAQKARILLSKID